MKNTIIIVLVTLILFQTLSMKQADEKIPVIYNKITNKELVAIVEDFIAKGKGSDEDLCSKFLSLRITKLDDLRGYSLTLSYMYDLIHNTYFKRPIIICAPIAGKKLFIETEDSYFIGANRPEVGLYFKDDCPEVFDAFIKETQKDKNRPSNLSDCGWLNHGTHLIIHFDYYGNFIDSTYQSENGKLFEKSCSEK